MSAFVDSCDIQLHMTVDLQTVNKKNLNMLLSNFMGFFSENFPEKHLLHHLSTHFCEHKVQTASLKINMTSFALQKCHHLQKQKKKNTKNFCCCHIGHFFIYDPGEDGRNKKGIYNHFF